MGILANRLRLILKNLLIKHPSVYLPLANMKRVNKERNLTVKTDTDIVIEGFPRCANSFATAAFISAQKTDIKIAHHLHAPAQIMRAVELGIPAIVLIRGPVDAVTSVIIQQQHRDIRGSLKEYISFYESLYPLRNGFIVAEFRDVVTDFSSIITAVNTRFGTDFTPYLNSESNDKHVFEIIEQSNLDRMGGIYEHRIPRPSEIRDASKGAIKQQISSPAYRLLLNRADNIYKLYSGPEPNT